MTTKILIMLMLRSAVTVLSLVYVFQNWGHVGGLIWSIVILTLLVNFFGAHS